MSRVVFVPFAVLAVGFSQTERWVYRYNGPGNRWDDAQSVVYGADGNVYAAGVSWDSSTYDFTVISLTPEGAERWVYCYDGPAGNDDIARALTYGSDGNIYAAGSSNTWENHLMYEHLTVVSLTPTGAVRWVYRHTASWSQAFSVVCGADGNIYAAGSAADTGSVNSDFTVISLTPEGTERWVYSLNGDWRDNAWSLVYGADGNIYAGGSASGYFAVVSLTPEGAQRWVYRYGNNKSDGACSLVYGADGNIYAAGTTKGKTSWDFTVASLTSTGAERWVYCYNGPADGVDHASSLVYGADGYIYVAGYSAGVGTAYDFAVVSLTPTGSQRWVYRYNGPGNGTDCLFSPLAYGADGGIYAAGASSGTAYDFTVLGLNPGDTWVYRYETPAHGDGIATSVACGADGSIYAAGKSQVGPNEPSDFVVVSLDPSAGVDEASRLAQGRMVNLVVQPNPAKTHAAIRYTLDAQCRTLLGLCDLSGRSVRTLVNSQQKPGRYSIHWDGKDDRGRLLANGVYFCRLRAGDYQATEKLVLRH